MMERSTLRAILREKIFSEVLCAQPKQTKWRVFVTDRMGLSTVSSVAKLHEVLWKNVSVVEDLGKARRPVPQDAIYLIDPCNESIGQVVRDFTVSSPLYSSAYIYFIRACPDQLLQQFVKMRGYVRAMNEIHVAFTAPESRIFTLDNSMLSYQFYSKNCMTRKHAIEDIADQLATVCVTLEEFPSVQYRDAYPTNEELALELQKRMTIYKADEANMGSTAEKKLSQLLIVDRGFDCFTTVLHDFTYQAMAYDILQIKKNIYKYKSSGVEKEAILDEDDALWVKFRHLHITQVVDEASKHYRQILQSESGHLQSLNQKDLLHLIKKMPQYQKELSEFYVHFNMAADCMEKFKVGLHALAAVEQDLATGKNDAGEVVVNPLQAITPNLLNENVTFEEKLRLILLHVQSSQSISKENLNRLFDHGGIPQNLRCIVTNLERYGVKILKNSQVPLTEPCAVKRIDRVTDDTFTLSRWSPVLHDVVDAAVAHRLDPSAWPSVQQLEKGSAAVSARHTGWHRGRNYGHTQPLPRLIVFVVGGLTYSEMRLAYDLSKKHADSYDIIIGSTHIINQNGFLDDLAQFSNSENAGNGC